MNTVVRPFPSSSQPRDVAVERRGTGVARTARRRERDFGVGYGRSSGYASGKRAYADRSWRPGLMRVR